MCFAGLGAARSPRILPAAPVAGQAADLAPFAYAYRKGAANNPVESQWLNPTPGMLCGLLWRNAARFGGSRSNSRRPASGRLRPRLLPQGSSTIVTRAAFAPFEEAPPARRGHPRQPKPEFTLKPLGAPVLTSRGSTLFTFASQNDINSIKVFYSGSDKKIGVPKVRAFGRSSWQKPVTLEVQWAFQPGRAGRRWDGSVEAYNGYLGPLAPLDSELVG